MAKTENSEIIQALHSTIQSLLESHGADASSLEKFAAFLNQDLALAPFFVKTMALVRSLESDTGKIVDLPQQIRSLFSPFLMELDLVVSATSNGASSADTNGGEFSASDDGESGKRGRRRTAASVAAVAKKTNTGSVAPAKCLVKNVSEAQAMYSSLPKNLNAGEFDLVDTITEMEILPTSFASIRKSQKVGGLAEISPAVSRPSHAPRLAKSFIPKREEMRLTSFLDFGSYSSFGPSYDSTDAVLGYHETVEYYTSLLALRQYEQQPILKTAPEPAQQGSKESTQGSQTMLTDVFPEDKVEEWTKESHRATPGSPKKTVAIADLEDYLKKAGIDLDGLLEQHNAPPSQHEFGSILSQVGDELAMLASLQQDRYNTTKLSAESLATLYSLAVPSSSQAMNPLTDIRDSITLKPTAQAKAQVEQLTNPSAAEKVVYQSLVKDLLRCVPYVPPSALVKPSAIRKLMKDGLQSTEDYVVRGSMTHPDRAPPVIPAQQVMPDASTMLAGHHQQMVANQLAMSGQQQQQQQQFMAQQFAQSIRPPNAGWPTMPNAGMPAGAPMWNLVGGMKGPSGIVQIGRTAPPQQPPRP